MKAEGTLQASLQCHLLYGTVIIYLRRLFASSSIVSDVVMAFEFIS